MRSLHERAKSKFRYIFSPMPERRTILAYWRTPLLQIFTRPIRRGRQRSHPSITIASLTRLYHRPSRQLGSSPPKAHLSLENMEQLEGEQARHTDDAFLENSHTCARQLFWFPWDVAANLNESGTILGYNIVNMHNTIHNWNTDPAPLSFQFGKGNCMHCVALRDVMRHPIV